MELVILFVVTMACGSALLMWRTARWRRTRVVLAVAVIAFGAGVPALYGFVRWQDHAYPWTDWSAPSAVLHLENETGQPVRLSWRFQGESEWNPLYLPDDRDPAPWSDDESVLREIGPLLQSKGPPWAVVLLLESALPTPCVTKSTAVSPDLHLRVRVARNGEVYFSTGSENWAGRPNFGREVLLH